MFFNQIRRFNSSRSGFGSNKNKTELTRIILGLKKKFGWFHHMMACLCILLSTLMH